MKVVAVLEIKEVVETGITGLWSLAKEHGGGVTREILRNYFSGKSYGYGLVIKKVHLLTEPSSMVSILPGMCPPQSYAYLSRDQFLSVERKIKEA